MLTIIIFTLYYCRNTYVGHFKKTNKLMITTPYYYYHYHYCYYCGHVAALYICIDLTFSYTLTSFVYNYCHNIIINQTKLANEANQ